jgi:hypothetical protein
MSDLQSEMRGDIKCLLEKVGEIKTAQEFHNASIINIEKKLDDFADKCPVGKNHENRIGLLEEKPNKKLNTLSMKSGIITSCAALLISVLAVISAIIFK